VIRRIQQTQRRQITTDRHGIETGCAVFSFWARSLFLTGASMGVMTGENTLFRYLGFNFAGQAPLSSIARVSVRAGSSRFQLGFDLGIAQCQLK
jgi:hypothetical protein